MLSRLPYISTWVLAEVRGWGCWSWPTLWILHYCWLLLLNVLILGFGFSNFYGLERVAKKICYISVFLVKWIGLFVPCLKNIKLPFALKSLPGKGAGRRKKLTQDRKKNSWTSAKFKTDPMLIDRIAPQPPTNQRSLSSQPLIWRGSKCWISSSRSSDSTPGKWVIRAFLAAEFAEFSQNFCRTEL